jgi:phage-related tail protein
MAGNSDSVSLRDYIDNRFEAQDKAVAAALAAQEKAVTAALAAADRAVSKAEMASERRFESMNEFRGALADSARLLMPRAEAEQTFRAMAEKIDDVTKQVKARDDRSRGLGQGWAILIAAVGVVATIVGLVAYFAK